MYNFFLFHFSLNELYPVGRLYCGFCQNKHEREIIKKLIESEAETLDFYDYPKTIAIMKKEEGKK